MCNTPSFQWRQSPCPSLPLNSLGYWLNPGSVNGVLEKQFSVGTSILTLFCSVDHTSSTTFSVIALETSVCRVALCWFFLEIHTQWSSFQQFCYCLYLHLAWRMLQLFSWSSIIATKQDTTETMAFSRHVCLFTLAADNRPSLIYEKFLITVAMNIPIREQVF